MTQTLSRMWEVVKAISVPLSAVLVGFIWNFHGDIVNLKTAVNHYKEDLVRLETRIEDFQRTTNLLRNEFLKINRDTSALLERTSKLSGRIDRIVGVMTKNLSLYPVLKSERNFIAEDRVDGWRDEVE